MYRWCAGCVYRDRCIKICAFGVGAVMEKHAGASDAFVSSEGFGGVMSPLAGARGSAEKVRSSVSRQIRRIQREGGSAPRGSRRPPGEKRHLPHLMHGYDGRRDAKHPRDAERGGFLEHRGRSPAAHARGRHTDTCAFSLEWTGPDAAGEPSAGRPSRRKRGIRATTDLRSSPCDAEVGRDGCVRVARLALRRTFGRQQHKRSSRRERSPASD